MGQFAKLSYNHSQPYANVVTLGPRQILMPTNCPRTQQFYEAHRITCRATPIPELLKAAGGIACLSGILWRDPL